MTTRNYILTNQLFTSMKQTQGYIHANHSNKYQLNISYLKVSVLVARPLRRDEGMAEEYGGPEAGQLPWTWTRGRRETKSHQRADGAKSP